MIRNVLTLRHLPKCKRLHLYILTIAISLLLVTTGCSKLAIERQSESIKVFQKQQYILRDGVVVDLVNDFVYVSGADARIEAIELSTGKAIWKNSVSAKPIGIIGKRLLVHVAPSGKGNMLTLSEYKASDGGLLSSSTLTLPKGVNSYIRNYGKGFLDILPYTISKEFVLTWSYYGGITRGDHDEGKDGVKKAPAGAYKVGASPKISYNKIKMSDLPKNFRSNNIFVTGNKKVKSKRGQQFYSSDKRHILVSWKETDDREFNSYRWKIYHATTKKLLGSQKAHLSYTPFFVKSSVLYHQVGPYLVVDGKKRQIIPLQLLAVDLKSGKKVWNKQILDTAYRGPTPP